MWVRECGYTFHLTQWWMLRNSFQFRSGPKSLKFILQQNQLWSKGNFTTNSQGGKCQIATPSKACYRSSETLAVWQITRPTFDGQSVPEHQHVFRTHLELSPRQSTCHKKWGFPRVLCCVSFIVTWNCFHTNCRFFRLKGRLTRTNTMNFARLLAKGSRTTFVSWTFLSSVTWHISTWMGMLITKTWGLGPQYSLMSMSKQPWV